jgi:hypothetical protein
MSELVGVWRLESWQGRDDEGNVADILGEGPLGSLVYTSEGFMSVQISRAGRSGFGSDDPLGGDQQQRSEAFASYLAYCGTYEVQEGQVVHRIEVSLAPDWVGTAQVRFFTLEDDVLVIRTAPIELAGKVQVNELRWRRGWRVA